MEIKDNKQLVENDKKEEFSLKNLKFSFDLSKTNYQLDTLQNRLLQLYLRSDPRFRKAFATNYTQDFFQFLRDKARLREPIHLSVIGQTRTFTQNNLIYTDKGWRKPSDMMDCKKVLSWNFDLEKYEWKLFELIIRKRDLKEKFYKITFSDGRKIELGEQHPIFTERKGWKKAFSLYSNIDIPFFSNYPNQKFKDEISIEKTRIIACLLSCGHLNNSHYKHLDKRDNKIYNGVHYLIGYSSPHKEMINLFRNDFKKVFGIEMRFKNDKRGINCYYLERGNKIIFEDLRKYIPTGKKSHIIEIPRYIFNASKEIQREFIATLYSGDGYVSNENSNGQVVYYTMSDKFANQLQLILLQYGIISAIYKKKKYNGNILNEVSITNKQNILNFYKFVKKLPNKMKNRRLKQIVRKLKDLEKYLKPRKFYIKNKEKIKIEDEYIYDIFVKDNNNFILNGILTHNSGKSSTSISIASFIMACFGKKFGIEYICGNAIEFLEKLKVMPEEKLLNSCFLIDEEKNLYGYGSISKKMNLQDVNSIIAVNNISTIMLNPISWADKNANYGLRVFGRCFETQTCRIMLYNLTERSSGSSLPLGNLYIPIFNVFLPKEYAEELNVAYLKKKNEWVGKEMRGENDCLADIRKKSAENFCKDKKFLQIKIKKEQLAYIINKLGSSWTQKECEDILLLTSLIQQGILE